ncbi:MAG: DUF4278 domain-containing protein [Elainellaceae cyanobacterium]
MVLRYRGVFYSYSPPKLETSEGVRVGCYRGAVWRSPIIQSSNCPQPFRILRYRGVFYATGTIKVKESFSEVE